MSHPYAPPQARVDRPAPKEPDGSDGSGWSGFGALQRIAIVLNILALPPAVLGLAILAVWPTWDRSVAVQMVFFVSTFTFGGAALASVCGLWPWRHVAKLRQAMFVLNATWALLAGLTGVVVLAVAAVREPRSFMVIAAVLVLLLLPAASALGVQVGAWRARRRG